MAEGNKPFVVTDRRKFTMDGEVRPDAEREPRAEHEAPAGTGTGSGSDVGAAAAPVSGSASGPVSGPRVVEPELREQASPEQKDGAHAASDLDVDSRQDLPPAPSEEQMQRAEAAYAQTTDRLDTAIRATNPGGEHPRAMDFLQMVQSFYMTAILQLGGATQEGQQPQVDLMGARQSIDMLGLLEQKTAGNLSEDEARLLESALFDARMAFLEITQAIARQAQAQAAAKGGPGGPGGFGGPGGTGGFGGGMGLVR